MSPTTTRRCGGGCSSTVGSIADRLELFHNNQLLHILDEEPSSVWDSDTGIRFHVNSRWLAALRVDLQHETSPSAGRRKTDSSYAVAVGVKL